MTPIISIEHVHMRLPAGGSSVTILDDISLEIPHKQIVAFVGPSGSGKSTLLGLMAGLDTPTSGTIHVNGIDITGLAESHMARFRRQNIGYIFQSFHLIPTLTALENVAVPLELQGTQHAMERAQELLADVGLAHRSSHYPVQLSGGEQQRVALARAFSCQPPLLLADEPTGNLDSKMGEQVIDLILGLHHNQGSTLVLVTHDSSLASCAERIVSLKDGKIVSDQPTPSSHSAERPIPR